MAQTTMVNFRIDADTKKEVEAICAEMGLTLTSAISVFLNKVKKERRIPFEITADPDSFYSENNIRHLERIIADIQAGKAHFVEHDLIED